MMSSPGASQSGLRHGSVQEDLVCRVLTLAVRDMPIFDHRCQACGYTWEAFVHKADTNPPCVKCNAKTTHVILSGSSGVMVRSSAGVRRRSVAELKGLVTGDIRKLNRRLLDVSTRLAVRLQRHPVAKTPQGRILVALFKKAVKTFRGIQVLKAERLIEESWIMLRVLLKTYINLIYFLGNDATELTRRWADASILEKLKYLRGVDFFEGTELAGTVSREAWQKLESEIKERYSEGEFHALKRYGFSALAVEARAEAVGLGREYQNLYRVASRSTHTFDPAETGMMDYVRDEETVNGLRMSRREALESTQNMLLGRLSLLLNGVVEDALIEMELWRLGIGYEKYRDKVDGLSKAVKADDREELFVWRE